MAELLPPAVVLHIRDVLLPADVHDALAPVHFPQDADFLLRTVAFSFHDLGPFYWPRPTLQVARIGGITPPARAISARRRHSRRATASATLPRVCQGP